MKRAICLILILVLLGSLAGCGRSTRSENAAAPADSSASYDAAAAEQENLAISAPGASSSAFMSAMEAPAMEAPAMEESMVMLEDVAAVNNPAAPTTNSTMADTADPQTAAEAAIPGQTDTSSTQGRRIIRNAQMRVQTEDVPDALDAATKLSVDIGGYTTQSRTWYVGDQVHASISFAVPVERFESALQAARALGDVLDESVSSQDVTSQYVDLEARILNLENTVERVRGFLDEAENVEEALEVNNHLSSLEAQLEVFKGQRNVLAQQTSFSTINIEFVPVPPEVTTKDVLDDAQGWSPLSTFNEALDALLELGQAGVDFGIWLVMLGVPALLALLVLGWIVRSIVRIFRRPRAASPAPQPEPADAN